MSAEVVKCISKVPQSDIHMLTFLIGIGPHVRLSAEARNLTVLCKVVETRNGIMGRRMAAFKARGGLRPSGRP